MNDKALLRQAAIHKLKNISDYNKIEIEEKLTENLLASSIWSNAKTIGMTISQGFEWNTKQIIEEGWKQDKIICVPKCFPNEKKLVFYQIHSFDQLESVYYQLLEPNPMETTRMDNALIDLLVVPGLLFDKQGYRIGFGGGYYDRFLTNYLNETVSLAFSDQIVDKIPSESFDIPVNHLITEKESSHR